MKNQRRLFFKSVVASVILHILVILFFALHVKDSESTKSEKSLVWIQVEPPKTSVQEESPNKEIVDSTAGKLVKEASPDSYLGEKNKIVDMQQVAKAEALEAAQKRQSTPQPSEPEQREVAKKADEKTPQLKSLGLPILEELGNSKGITQEDRNWAESGSDMQVSSPEYIKGLKEGEQTALNTREYVYFGYFKRIRTLLDQSWRPILKEKLERFFRTGRYLANDKEHTTKTLVTLDKNGEVVRVQVLEESGTRDLDDAAIRAFNKAGPFPNPPQGLVDSAGVIQIRWDFVLRT